MDFQTFSIRTARRDEFVDISEQVASLLDTTGIENGLCLVSVPHTTAGITINEAADSSVKRDILMELDKIVPLNDAYTHGEGNSAAHIKTSLMGSSISVTVQNKRLVLGRWQGIYFCEFDGPRTRDIHCTFFEG
ncbi:MAG: YjbQ family protein [Spirochaetales bacterium]|jgi:secondary thiamine-phosphate synthase enzyme|nr:YjbQ family protein [Spirochaetales bacterium]